MKTTKIILVDDHKMFREGLRALLSQSDELHVLADFGSGEELLASSELGEADVILMDIDLGAMSGIEVTAEVLKKHENVQVMAISMHTEQSYVLHMLEAGASGYLLKNAGLEEMLLAIRTLAQGASYYSREVSAHLIRSLSQPKKRSTLNVPLTARELEVLKLIVEECSNGEIAERLFISPRTVDTHRRNLLEKLGVKNNVGLVKYALQNDLV